jgi:hypothetical protein
MDRHPEEVIVWLDVDWIPPRQLQNLRGYERNEYYEHDSNAVPFGSRVWWELKQGEHGGGR